MPRLASVAVLLAALVCGLAGAAWSVPVTFTHAAPGAGKVCLAGEFNSWSDAANPMANQDGTWTLTLDLAPGTYLYKFVVDGTWKQDANNPEAAADGFGGNNSVLKVGDGGAVTAAPAVVAPKAVAAPAAGGQRAVTFSHSAPGAAKVSLAGEFNGWSDAANPMTNQDGTWTLTLNLAPGSYQYKFVVDGAWKQDPNNPEAVPDGFGGNNSVLKVGDGGAVAAAPAAPAAVAPKAVAAPAAGGQCAVTFSHSAPGAAKVNLAGEFNGWSDAANPMTNKDGIWTLTLNLAPGSYQYKFVVDGTWTQDPLNPAAVDDGLGGKNSLFKVPAGKDKIEAAASGGDAVGAAGAPGGGDGEMRSVEFAFTPVISGITNVFLAGTFNDWNDSKTPMLDADKDGTYTVKLLLAQGTYQYKFVVDGNWKADPNNPNGTDDGFGGQNSVLKVDASFATITIGLGDAKVFSDDLEPVFDYSTCNPISPTEVVLTARAHLNDVDRLVVHYQVGGGAWTPGESPTSVAMKPAEKDASFQYYRATVKLGSPDDVLQYVIAYHDGDHREFFGSRGMTPAAPAAFTYRAADHTPFLTPEWAKDGIVYQIFPERFANGDKANDPDFQEAMYEGANALPASGKINGEYFHMVDDWYDIAGLLRSPYRTDGKPDYFSFYGGDIAGIRQKLDYLNDLGITVLYFNPLNQGMSNHKYDPTDYLKIDPHFGTPEEFKAFVQDCHAHGIRIVVDVAFNHTGNWHFAFRDAVAKGPDSPYYNWYEFKRWPLPTSRDFNASDYYDCWWGFGLHPNLNFDLKRSNADENNIQDVALASPNQPLVDYVLKTADVWLGEYDIDGFRLDVPNEVPFWFWKLFRERCDQVKKDVWLVGELWGNAGRWIGPECFDSTMNYKFFRDPVMDFFGKGSLDAASFDARLSPGRFQYPPQSVAVMMNLMDSHDTVRFLTSAGDVRRLMLGAMFGMTYVGMPHIWYGNEVGMVGDKDPDCRRPMDWRYDGDPRRVALRAFYGTITRLRRDTPVLRQGSFTALETNGRGYLVARELDGKLAVAAFNAGQSPVTLTLSQAALLELAGAGAPLVLRAAVGPDQFPQAEGGSFRTGDKLDLRGGDVTITIPALSGAILLN
jgi:glycosidase